MARFKPKILVVDDEVIARTHLAQFLKAKGYEVVEAASGQMALQLARSEWPALIVLDIVLPDLPGTKVLEQLSRDPLTKSIPVLLLTAKPDILDIKAETLDTPHQIVEKAGRLEDLLSVIHRMLAGNRSDR
jgi:CheY-like chemotaxis protein